jgi:predicted transcriptional regulator
MDWVNDFEHSSVTDENRESFSKAMSKYSTAEDAIVGGFEAMKAVGKPFKLPASLDKLPDDTVRADFTTQAHKLFGITHAKSVDDLKDFDFTVGMDPDENGEKKVDELLVNGVKQLVVDKQLNINKLPHYIELYNKAMAKARRDSAAQAEAAKIKAANETNEALAAHPDFGSMEKVKEQSELLRRAIQNSGITPEEYEQVGEEMASSMLTKHPVMARVMLKLLAPLGAEGSSEAGKGGTPPPKKRTTADDLPQTAKALGWNE